MKVLPFEIVISIHGRWTFAWDYDKIYMGESPRCRIICTVSKYNGAAMYHLLTEIYGNSRYQNSQL